MTTNTVNTKAIAGFLDTSIHQENIVTKLKLTLGRKMNNPYDRYTKFATEYADSGFVAPKRFLNKSEQQTIAIYTLLSDGEWHTAQEISDRAEVSKRTVHNIMRSLITPFAIASGQQGYCIPQLTNTLQVRL